MLKGRVSRRCFLFTSAATVAASGWAPLISIAEDPEPARKRLSLNGAWKVARPNTQEHIQATVPGCIHTDLFAAGKIPDPFHRDNERLVQWVSAADWVYRRTFNVLPDVLTHDALLLRCEGLDTLSTIHINGRELGKTDNMFRTWEFDAKPALRQGLNSIEISFSSPLPYMADRQAWRPLAEWVRDNEPKGRGWVRKEPCGFGWDLAPSLVTCGIWRNISLEVFNQARIEDVLILQDHSPRDVVRLEIELTSQTIRSEPLRAWISVTSNDERVAASPVEIQNGKGRAWLYIAKPKLWWPAGMGAQPLYDVQVDLYGASNTLLDRTSSRIGLRQFKLLDANSESSLRVAVNNVPFFWKGANWIPPDTFPSRVTPQVLRRYVADAVAVNMNGLRFWGGGYYEEDELFNACDEAGLCVWLDFKFANSSYPVFDKAFMENVRQEARDNIRRLRNHPCIALWCGNNEVSYEVKDHWSDHSMGRADYEKLFKIELARQVTAMAPQANYVPGSPAGDTHFWDVWHGGKTFEAYRSVTGFSSEFGFQSFPVPKTVRTYTSERDRASLTTPVMDWHQRSARGNSKIIDMVCKYFRAPKDFESALWLSQIVQAYGIKMGVEYLRQTMPKSMGSIYWQYNDCWPGASWSSVDYYGRWKALHYIASHFYAPLMLSAIEDAQNGTVNLFVTSDLLQPSQGIVHWNITDPAGRTLAHDFVGTEIPARQSRKIRRLDLRDLVQAHGAKELLIWLKLVVDAQTRSENFVTLVPPKDLQLRRPSIKASVRENKQGFGVTLTSDKPALWTWLELADFDARLSDNFVHLQSESPREILVCPDRPMTKAEFVASLRVRSLYDTYSAA